MCRLNYGMKCDHEWFETRKGMCLCTECGTQIEIKDTKERVIREKSYFNVITTMEGLSGSQNVPDDS